jgi:hypothetical protein
MSTIINEQEGIGMKKLIALILLVLLYAGWTMGGDDGGNLAGPEQGEDIGLLRMAFAATGAAVMGAEIHGWSVISDKYYSPREAEAAIEIMAREFELKRAEYSVHLRSTGQYGYAVMEYNLSESVWLRLQVQSLDNETIASVEIRQTNQRDLESRYQKARLALQAVGTSNQEVNITSCLEGYLDARLRDSEKLNLAYAAFNAVEAYYQEGIDSNGIIVWSGWSPLFAHSVETGRKEVNFGIAFRPESGGRRTFVRVATPVLPGSY